MLLNRALLYSLNSIFFLILNLYTAHHYSPEKYALFSTLILVHLLATQLVRRGYGEAINADESVPKNHSNSTILLIIVILSNLLYFLIDLVSGFQSKDISTLFLFACFSSFTLMSEFNHWEIRNFEEARVVVKIDLLINTVSLGLCVCCILLFDRVELIMIVLLLKSLISLVLIFRFRYLEFSPVQKTRTFEINNKTRVLAIEFGCMLATMTVSIVMLNSKNIALADYRLVYAIFAPITFYIGMERFVFGRRSRERKHSIISFSIFASLSLTSFMLFGTIQRTFFKSYVNLSNLLLLLILIDIFLVYVSSLIISIIPIRFQDPLIIKSRIIWFFGSLTLIYPISLATTSIEIAVLLTMPTVFSTLSLMIGFINTKRPGRWETNIQSPYRILLMKLRYWIENFVPGKFRIKLRYFKAKITGQLDIEMFFLQSHMTDRKVFIDIGSNVGIYSYYYSSKFQKVISFDPYPNINVNLSALRIKNLEFYNVALSDYVGKGWLSTPIMGDLEVSSHSSLNDSHRSMSARYNVEIRTLDSYSLSDVDLIKIDTEGHELQVISGARETIAQCTPILLVEIEQRYLDRPIHEVFEFIFSLGYEGFFISSKKLHLLSVFRLDQYQNTSIRDQNYVFNFIFVHKLHPLSFKFSNLSSKKMTTEVRRFRNYWREIC
jgi:FkbM family methyltransferase